MKQRTICAARGGGGGRCWVPLLLILGIFLGLADAQARLTPRDKRKD